MTVLGSCAHVQCSADVSVTANVFSTVPMNTVVVDTDGFWGASNPERFTAQRSGTYLFFSGPQTNRSGTNTNYNRIARNGSVVSIESQVDGFTTFGNNGATQFWVGSLNAGDYLAAQVFGGGTASSQCCIMEVADDSCMLTSAAQQNSISTWTKLTYSTTAFDPTGMAGSSRINILKSGYYLILTMAAYGDKTQIALNGTVSGLYGSFGWQMNNGQCDYAVALLQAGDYVEHYGIQERFSYVGPRHFAAVYLGTARANLAYAYASTSHNNSEPLPYVGIIDCDAEWYDVGNAHPYGTEAIGADPAVPIRRRIGLSTGNHLFIGKFAADGYFLNNNAIQLFKNGTGYPPWEGGRHGDGEMLTEMGVAIVPGVATDYVEVHWNTNALGVVDYAGIYSNMFITDVADVTFLGQIYRRVR